MKIDQGELDTRIRKAVAQMRREKLAPCPDEETLACYFEGLLAEKERDELEAHIAACPECCDEIIALNRVIQMQEDAEAASEKAIKKAMDLVQEAPSGVPPPPTQEPRVSPITSNEQKEKVMMSLVASESPKSSWKPLGYGVAVAFASLLLIMMVPYLRNIPYFGATKSTSPIELAMNITGKVSKIQERGTSLKPSRILVEEGDVLRSGDGFQIKFKTTQDAYVYTVLHSTSGGAELIFPSQEITTPNKVQGGQSYTLPSEDLWFFLDENAGIETVFVLASKRPIDDMGLFINSLKGMDANEVERRLTKKADVIEATSFRHIDEKALKEIQAFDSSFAGALNKSATKSSAFYETIEANENLAKAVLAVAREQTATEEKLIDKFEEVRRNHFLEKTRGSGSAVYEKASPAVVIVVTESGEGSGVIYDQYGHVITNWHVVDGAEKALVVYKPTHGIEVKKEYAVAAEVIKTDGVADLALLEIVQPRKDRTPIPLGEVKRLKVGQEVHAIGHPAGEVWTYTKGTVSQIRPGYEWTYEDGSQHKSEVIQTQTPINPGNSGGPLLDNRSRLIGINSFGAQGEGLNYAVSVNEIKRFLKRKEGRTAKIVKPSIVSISEAFKPKYSKIIDDDKNGIPELILLDMDGDKRWDVGILDKDQDGKPDQYAFDTDQNGTPDRWLQDHDGDDFPETHLIDSNEDGTVDLVGIDTNRDFEIDRYVNG